MPELDFEETTSRWTLERQNLKITEPMNPTSSPHSAHLRRRTCECEFSYIIPYACREKMKEAKDSKTKFEFKKDSQLGRSSDHASAWQKPIGPTLIVIFFLLFSHDREPGSTHSFFRDSIPRNCLSAAVGHLRLKVSLLVPGVFINATSPRFRGGSELITKRLWTSQTALLTTGYTYVQYPT